MDSFEKSEVLPNDEQDTELQNKESLAAVEALPTLSEEGESSLAEESAEDLAEEANDWQAKYLAVENTLADSLAFASLYAPYAKAGEAFEKSPVYQRFLAMRSRGLTVSEAFAAAGCDLLPAHGREGIPSKAHLVSSVPRASVASSRMSSEELAIARELLGDGYSSEELHRLFNRVKGSK